jgi:hypothetical protein
MRTMPQEHVPNDSTCACGHEYVDDCDVSSSWLRPGPSGLSPLELVVAVFAIAYLAYCYFA